MRTSKKILPVRACLELPEEAYRDLGNGIVATVPRYDAFGPTSKDEFYEYKTMSASRGSSAKILAHWYF